MKSPFIILYRWRIREGEDQAFIEGWTTLTDELRARGSLGSRLHFGSDGIWYSYAQWPDAKARETAFAAGPLNALATAQLRAAIEESFPEVVLGHVAAGYFEGEDRDDSRIVNR